MTVARSVADVLADHVVFEVESIDRMYLNVWQPRLAYGGGVQGFFVGHRGYHYASTALMDPMTKAFVADIHGFVAARGLELISFAKGQRKDDLAQQFLAKFTDEEGVLFVGRAQEKAGVWHTQRRYSPSTGGSYAWLVRSTAFINFFYFYCVDADFGPFFLKFSTYFPYTAKLCINGNEWAKRQAANAGIGLYPTPRSLRLRVAGWAAVRGGGALTIGPGRGRCSPRWTTGSPPSTTQPTWRGYSRSATAWARNTSTRCYANGYASCPTRSCPRTRPPATATNCRSCRRSSR